MKRICSLTIVALCCLAVAGDASARGGGGGFHGGGGGGGFRGGGDFGGGNFRGGGGDFRGGGGDFRGGGNFNGYRGGDFNRTPSVARPSFDQWGARTQWGGEFNRGYEGGVRPGEFQGGAVSRGQLQNFLDLGGGGAGEFRGAGANDFLQNHPGANQILSGGGMRPGQGGSGEQRPGFRPGEGGSGELRPGGGMRPGEGGSGERRPNAGNNGRWANRPNKIDNPADRQQQRQDRRNEVAQQLRNHDHDFHHWYNHDWWNHHNYWHWNHPWGWYWGAPAWGALSGWFPWGWGQPAYYNYGENIYYSGDQVYYGDQPVATAQQYADQAQQLVASAPADPPANDNWMSLGVFALSRDGEASGSEPTMFVQLAVSKDGMLAGSYQNTSTNQTQAISGMVDKKTQRAAWGVVKQQWPVWETGVYNLTQKSAPVLIHFSADQTQQWLLVRVDKPEGAGDDSGAATDSTTPPPPAAP